MKQLSKIASAIRPSATLAVDTKAKQLRAQGLDVLSFGIGEPDFDTPDFIKAAAISAIEKGVTKYTPAAGLPELRKAAAYRLKEDFGLDYTESQIVIASGAKHVLYVLIQTLLDPGDEVILPAPYWVSYYEMIRMAGGIPVVVDTKKENGFLMTAEELSAAVTDKTKAVILNSPSNPSGSVYSEALLRQIASVCNEKDLYIISDEIYYRLVYDDVRFFSIACVDEQTKARTIVVNGVSKSYAMTGWRIGYAAAPEEIAAVMTRFLSQATGAPGSMCQAAAIEALSGPQDCVEQMRLAFDERRRYLYERLNSMDGISCLRPDGAFYVMIDLENLLGKTIAGRLIDSDSSFCDALLEKELVALTPCVGFGKPGFARWSYAADMDSLKKGLDRLEHFLKS